METADGCAGFGARQTKIERMNGQVWELQYGSDDPCDDNQDSRSGGVLCSIGNSLFQCGGANNDGYCKMDMCMFDTLFPERGWRKLLASRGSLPSARIAHSLVALPAHNVLIMFGGWDGHSVLNDIWEWNLNTRTWRNLTPIVTNLPTPRSNFMGCRVASHQIFYHGGLGQFYLSIFGDTLMFDYPTKTFRTFRGFGEVPRPLRSATCVCDLENEMVYVFGGLREKSPREFLLSEKLRHEWIERSSHLGRDHVRDAYMEAEEALLDREEDDYADGHLVVIDSSEDLLEGGEEERSRQLQLSLESEHRRQLDQILVGPNGQRRRRPVEHVKVTNAMYSLNLQSREWRRVRVSSSCRPRARMFSVMAVLPDGRLYIFGGRGRRLKMPKYPDTWSFDPESRRWERVHDGRNKKSSTHANDFDEGYDEEEEGEEDVMLSTSTGPLQGSELDRKKRKLASMAAPSARSGHMGCVVQGSSLWWVFGGSSNKRLSSVWTFRSGKNLRWRETTLLRTLEQKSFVDIEIECLS